MTHTIFRTINYKGRIIEQVETFMQRFFVIDGHFESACWSVLDAKRVINGLTPNSCTVSINEEDLI